jgi:hypothetical protein
MQEKDLKCVGCKKDFPEIKDEWGICTSIYSEYRNDERTAFVCNECYSKGVRTPLQKKIEKSNKSS